MHGLLAGSLFIYVKFVFFLLTMSLIRHMIITTIISLIGGALWEKQDQ